MKLTSEEYHKLIGMKSKENPETKSDFLIGIDPDIKKSGVAVFNCQDNKFEYIGSLEISEIFKLLEEYKLTANRIEIHIEAGWLKSKANFHNKGSNRLSGETVSLHIGRNHGYGMCLRDALVAMNYSVIERNPLIKKLWKVAGAWTPFGRMQFEKITGFKKGTITDDERDAVLLVYLSTTRF